MANELTGPEERPRIQPAWTATDRVLRVAGLSGAGALIAMMVTVPFMPKSVPMHFGLTGRPGRWGSPWELLLVAFIGLLLYTALTLVLRIPHHYSYPWPITPSNAERQYSISRRLLLGLRAVLIWFFVFMMWETARIARGDAETLSPLYLLVLFGAIGSCIAWYFIAARRAR